MKVTERPVTGRWLPKLSFDWWLGPAKGHARDCDWLSRERHGGVGRGVYSTGGDAVMAIPVTYQLMRAGAGPSHPWTGIKDLPWFKGIITLVAGRRKVDAQYI